MHENMNSSCLHNLLTGLEYTEEQVLNNSPFFTWSIPGEHSLPQKKDKMSALAAIVFAHPSNEFVTKQITPLLNYLHYRSSNHIDFFFGGYGKNWPDKRGEESTFRSIVGGDTWYFCDQSFNDFIETVENLTNFKYCGEPVCIITTIYKNSDLYDINFKECLVCNLRNLFDVTSDPNIVFFEKLIAYSKVTINPTPFDLSDRLVIKNTGKRLQEWLLKFLKMEDYWKQNIEVLVRDISK